MQNGGTRAATAGATAAAAGATIPAASAAAAAAGGGVVLLVAGNGLRGDDGAARAALALIRAHIPDGVTLADSAVCLDAVPDAVAARAVIIADTVVTGAGPGSICRLPIATTEPLPLPSSLHDCGPLAAVAVARQLGWRGEAILVGIEPLTLDGEGLSDPVQAAIPAFAAAIRKSLSAALAPATTAAVPASQ
ncbi:MAG: hydrogenase maturation protease [Chloroflexota bacterium]